MMRVSRRSLLTSVAAAPAALTFPGLVSNAWSSEAEPAAASASEGITQVPGVQRFSVGDIRITSILDGYFDFQSDWVIGMDEVEAQRLLADAFIPADRLRAAVNAYVIHNGDQTILVDTGTRDALGPTLGRFPDNLAAAGVDPASINTVLITHMHPDHINGIVTAEGTAAFPNAELVIQETEWAYWTAEETLSNAPDDFKPFVQLAQAAVVPYEGRVRLIAVDGEVTPGISAMALPGHTPGHTGYLVESGGDALLIWGDTVHLPMFHFAHPDWTVIFDGDPRAAAATRSRTFDMAAAERLKVAGMHLQFPGIGHVIREGTAYGFVPATWQYEL